MKVLARMIMILFISGTLASGGMMGSVLGVTRSPATMGFSSMSQATSLDQEMTPQWVYDIGAARVSISDDGNYIGAGGLYLFNRSGLVWNYDTGGADSISMSRYGEYIGVGGGGNFYLFGRDSMSVLIKYHVGYEVSRVVLSSDGKYAVVGAGPSAYHVNQTSKVYVFEREQPQPLWTKALTGNIKSLSMSKDGGYFVVETGVPGVVYVFATKQETPLWTYNLGKWNGGAVISGDGNWVIAAGGSQGDGSDFRIFKFSRHSSSPVWQYPIATLTCGEWIAISYNGSIFALSPVNENQLLLFDSNKAHVISSPNRGRISMSSDGKYIFLGSYSRGGVFCYEYSDGELKLESNYTRYDPYIIDLCSSSDGNYVVASGSWQEGLDNRYGVFFFGNLHQAPSNLPTLTDFRYEDMLPDGFDSLMTKLGVEDIAVFGRFHATLEPHSQVQQIEVEVTADYIKAGERGTVRQEVRRFPMSLVGSEFISNIKLESWWPVQAGEWIAAFIGWKILKDPSNIIEQIVNDIYLPDYNVYIGFEQIYIGAKVTRIVGVDVGGNDFDISLSSPLSLKISYEKLANWARKNDYWWAASLCPVGLSVVDMGGGRVGICRGQAFAEVANAYHFGEIGKPQLVMNERPTAADVEYRIEVEGVDNGTYTLQAGQRIGGEISILTLAEGTAIHIGEIATYRVLSSQTGLKEMISWWAQCQLWIIGGAVAGIVALTISILLIRRRRSHVSSRPLKQRA